MTAYEVMLVYRDIVGEGSVDSASGGRKCERWQNDYYKWKKSDFPHAKNFKILRQMKQGISINSSDFSAVHNFCAGWSLLLFTPGTKKPI